MIFSSPPASSSIRSTPTGRTLMAAARPPAHDSAGHEGAGVGDQYVAGVAVARERVRNEAVISEIAHRGIEKATDHQRAGVLVHFVFDRLPPPPHAGRAQWLAHRA